MLTWAYNGPFLVCWCPTDAHSADIEHLTVHTNEDATRLEWVFIGAHGVTDGVWRRADQMEVAPGDQPEPTRPVVYAASHSQSVDTATARSEQLQWCRFPMLMCALSVLVTCSSSGLYESPGTWWRICGFANDLVLPKSADSRSLWNPAVRLVFDSGDPRFGATSDGVKVLEYNGCLSEDGVGAPHSQPFWERETAYSNNCFRRCWWPCRYIEWTGDNDFCQAHLRGQSETDA